MIHTQDIAAATDFRRMSRECYLQQVFHNVRTTVGQNDLLQKGSMMDERYFTVGVGDRRKLEGRVLCQTTYRDKEKGGKTIRLINFTNDTERNCIGAEIESKL